MPVIVCVINLRVRNTQGIIMYIICTLFYLYFIYYFLIIMYIMFIVYIRAVALLSFAVHLASAYVMIVLSKGIKYKEI